MVTKKQPAAVKTSTKLPVPGIDETVFLTGVAALAVAAIIDWPVAVGIGVAHIATKHIFSKPKSSGS